MNNDKQVIFIKENESFSLRNSSKELKYIRDKFNNCFTFIKGKDETILTCKNAVGVLELGNTIYRIYPKVGELLNIFNMINKIASSSHRKINSKGYLYFDPKVIIDVEDENKELIDVLILIFLKELDKVKRKGYTKCYIKKEDNIYFLRGKLSISKQIKKNYLGNKFFCKYNDLVYYTSENIIIFLTIDKLLKRYSLKKDTRSKLLTYFNEFKGLFNVDGVNEFNISNIKYLKNRTNTHYETLVDIAMVILNNKFASSIKWGQSKFCNFMIKTDLLFEQYIFVILDEIIRLKYSKYYLEYQYTIDTIAKIDNKYQIIENSFLKMDSDIVIFEKLTNKPVLIIDTKYIDIYQKSKLNNYAYYQMLSYLIGLNSNGNNNLSAILLAHGKSANSYKVPSDKSNMYILTKGINILKNNIEVKNELEKIIEPFLNSCDNCDTIGKSISSKSIEDLVEINEY